MDRNGDPADVARAAAEFDAPPAALTTERGLVNRVIGRPGDVIELLHGPVDVNGSAIVEPYPASATRGAG